MDKEFEAEIKAERNREYIGEYNDGVKSEWIRNNIEDLRAEFCDTLIDEFNAYCDEEYKMVEEK